MTNDSNGFLSRWSKRKLAAGQADAMQTPTAPAAAGPQPAEASAPPELPPVDQLTPDSDFSSFMKPRVDDALRRAALKKLFADPRFNVADDLDEYAGDYTLLDSLAPGAAEQLAHARTTLFGSDAPQQESRAELAARGTTEGQAGELPNQRPAAAEPARSTAPAGAPEAADPGPVSEATKRETLRPGEPDSGVG